VGARYRLHPRVGATMRSLVVRLALVLPFLFIAWLAWVRTLQQERERPKTSLTSRDAIRVARLMRRHLGGPAESKKEEPQAVLQQAAVRPVSEQVEHPQVAEVGETSRSSAAACPGRKPFHTLLTATAQPYQQWQCRIMYWHWKKQRDADPAGACTELTGLTRLVANGNGDPDGFEGEIPSVFVKEYSHAELMRFHGYRVINRPYSVVQFLKTNAWRSIPEEYLYIAETDHILTQPLPNRAALGSPMAYIFGYMGPNPAHQGIIQRVWPEGGASGYKRVQSIGPSPVVIHRRDLEAIASSWEEIAVALKTNQEADNRLGWVIEMWGYAIAAAKLGLKHQEFADFQVEPGGLSVASQLRGFPTRYWLFHYTYQFEYMLDGTPCQPWTIGEYSLDKRHFSDEHPAYPLPTPPPKANPAAFYLLNAFNEAMGNITTWPRRQPEPGSGRRPIQTTYGRRRLDWFSRHANGFATELRTNALVKELAGSEWQCRAAGEESTLTLGATGDASGLKAGGSFFGRAGRWGSMNDPSLGDECPVYGCLFIDLGGSKHDARVEGTAGARTGLRVFNHMPWTEKWTCAPKR